MASNSNPPKTGINDDLNYQSAIALVTFGIFSFALFFVLANHWFVQVFALAEKSRVLLELLTAKPEAVGTFVTSQLILLTYIRNKKWLVLGNSRESTKENSPWIAIKWFGDVRIGTMEMAFGIFTTWLAIPYLRYLMEKDYPLMPWWIMLIVVSISMIIASIAIVKRWYWGMLLFLMGGAYLFRMITEPKQEIWSIFLLTYVLMPIAWAVMMEYQKLISSYEKLSIYRNTPLADNPSAYLFTMAKTWWNVSALLSIAWIWFGLYNGYNIVTIAYVYFAFILTYVSFSILLNWVPWLVDVTTKEGEIYNKVYLMESTSRRLVLLDKKNNRIILNADSIKKLVVKNT